MQKNYSIGLDIGTNSVGYAVVDANGRIVKKGNKSFWGVRLVRKTQTAEARRLARSVRRRVARRTYRVDLLRKLFQKLILEKDESFFLRMKESFLHEQDKSMPGNIRYNNFTDKEFSKIPTVYHLKKHLINLDKKFDIRLIYLALHHSVKYRGHFLYENKKFTVNDINIDDDLKELTGMLCEYFEIPVTYSEDTFKKAKEILLDEKSSRKDKQKKVSDLFVPEKGFKDCFANLFKLILGLECNFNKLFDTEMYEGSDGKALSFSLDDPDYEEIKEEYYTILDENAEILKLAEKIYGSIILKDILSGERWISYAFVKRYEKHEKELKCLKDIFKRYLSKEDYKNFFKNEDGKTANYANYIKGDAQIECKGNNANKTAYQVFAAALSKILDKIEAVEIQDKIAEIKTGLAEEKYIRKLRTKFNGAIPHQLNLSEVEKILDNQTKYYPELKNIKEKILSLISFRIPFYVGPLNKNADWKTGRAWVVRGDEKITPWNFKDVVKLEESAQAFIENLTNDCTYLFGEPVLPKKSLLFSRYCVLNEVNKLRINGKHLDKNAKQTLLSKVFEQKSKVKETDIIEWARGYFPMYGSNTTVEGFQKEKECSASLSSYIDFCDILGKEYVDKNNNEIEQLIKDITIMKDKMMLKERLKKNYPHILEKNIEKIAKKNYSGWGRLSGKLLNGITIPVKDTRKTIIQIMEETNKNLMQILPDFEEVIIRLNFGEKKTAITYDDIKEMACSPSVKRLIWQTVRIVDEIISVIGEKPDYINIEFSREEKKKERTKSRFSILEEKYKLIGDTRYGDTKKLLKNYVDKKETFDNDKFFLYCLQNGKCMYCGQQLELSRLSEYHTDHIVPRALVTDNSIENKVLVHFHENTDGKADNAVIDEAVRNRMKAEWYSLRKHGLMGAKKYDNLMREAYEPADKASFINRQLVETRQIIKNIANLFTECEYTKKPNCVMAIRTGVVKDIRDIIKMPKNEGTREINDYHHACDAYLCCAAQRFIEIKYKDLLNEFQYGSNYFGSRTARNMAANEYKESLVGFRVAFTSVIFKNNEVFWNHENEIRTIRSVLSQKDVLVTRQLKEDNGQFYCVNRVPAAKAKIPIKARLHKGNNTYLDPAKYGGYTGEKPAFIVLISYLKGKAKKLNYSLENFNITDVYALRAGDEKKKITNEEIVGVLKKKHPAYLELKIVRKILLGQLISLKGTRYNLASSSELNNAIQLHLPLQTEKFICDLYDNKVNWGSYENFDGLADEFMRIYIEKLEKYYPKFDSFLKKIKKYYNSENGFGKLPRVNQKEKTGDGKSKEIKKSKIDFIKQCLTVTNCYATNGNFQAYWSYNREGRIGSFSFKEGELKIINQSVTGIYENIVKI